MRCLALFPIGKHLNTRCSLKECKGFFRSFGVRIFHRDPELWQKFLFIFLLCSRIIDKLQKFVLSIISKLFDWIFKRTSCEVKIFISGFRKIPLQLAFKSWKMFLNFSFYVIGHALWSFIKECIQLFKHCVIVHFHYYFQFGLKVLSASTNIMMLVPLSFIRKFSLFSSSNMSCK